MKEEEGEEVREEVREEGLRQLGGKIEMSNYQMTAVDSRISIAMLGKFCSGSQTGRSCLCAPLRLSAHVWPSPVQPMQTRTQLLPRIPLLPRGEHA